MRAPRGQPGGRSNIAFLCLVLVFAVAFLTAAAAASASGPQDAIRGFYSTLLTTMKAGARLGEGGRYAALAPVVQQVFDVPFMTRLAVGPDWAGLRPGQQQRVT